MRFESVLFLMTASAFAGPAALANGGGYNGPITAGDSIPVKLDRAIPLTSLTRTHQICIERTIQDLAQQFARQPSADFNKLYSKNSLSHYTAKWTVTDSVHAYEYARGIGFTPIDEKSGLKGFGFWAYKNQNSTPYNNDYDETTFQLSRDVNQEFVQTTFNKIVFPFVSFKAALTEALYDELGNLDKSALILSGLMLKIPADYKDRVVLVNAETQVASSLKANVKGWIDCFYNEIQK